LIFPSDRAEVGIPYLAACGEEPSLNAPTESEAAAAKFFFALQYRSSNLKRRSDCQRNPGDNESTMWIDTSGDGKS